jgi:hypothetical protein
VNSGASQFGAGVSLSGDGKTALIGGGGSGWLYSFSGGAWLEQKEIDVDLGYTGSFSYPVTLSSDGNTALIAAPPDMAWIYVRSATGWDEQQELTFDDSGGGDPDESVALSADGDTALMAGPGNGGEIGAWVYTRSGNVWSQLQEISPEGGASALWSVALSPDGSTALLGNYSQAYAYTLGSIVPTNTVAPSLSGSPRAGAVLSCSAGTWNGEPTSYAYHWYRNGTLLIWRTVCQVSSVHAPLVAAVGWG